MIDTYKFMNDSCSCYLESFKLSERPNMLQESITNFCNEPNEITAKKVYENFLSTFRLSGLFEILEAMQKFEIASSGLIPKQRDHYIHTVNVFLLGLSMYYCNEKIQKAVDNSFKYPDMYPTIEEEFLYRWGITSLFHDVGYPLEIAYKTIKEFTSILMLPNLVIWNDEVVGDGSKRSLQDTIAILEFKNLDDILYINILNPHKKFKNEYYGKYPNFKENLPQNIFSVISRDISSNLEFASEDVIYKKILTSLKNGLNDGLLDHGIYSAIILLKWLNEAFLRADWNPAYYYIPTVNAATAILLHNAYDYIFKVPPFNLGPLSIEKHPLAFLLMLCDKIQETDRVSYGYIQKGAEFISSSIKIDADVLLLNLIIKSSEDKNLARLTVEDMKSTIINSLDIHSVFKKFEIEFNK